MGRTGQFADGQQGRPQRLEVLGLDFGLEGRFQDFGEGRNDGRPVEHGLTGGGRFLADRSGDRHGQQSQKNKLQTTWQTEKKTFKQQRRRQSNVDGTHRRPHRRAFRFNLS